MIVIVVEYENVEARNLKELAACRKLNSCVVSKVDF